MTIVQEFWICKPYFELDGANRFASAKSGAMKPSAPDTSVEAIAYRLRLLRRAMGWSQVAASTATGINTTTWNNYERGVGPIPYRSALKVCQASGASLDWIYRGIPAMMPVKLMADIDRLAEEGASLSDL